MRISDWSSDVCCSDLFFVCWGLLVVITTVISDLTYRLSGYMHWQFALGQDRITFILRHILIAALVAFLLLRYFWLRHQWTMQVRAEGERSEERRVGKECCQYV